MPTPLVALLALGAVICVALAVYGRRQATISRWVARAATMARGLLHPRPLPIAPAARDAVVESLSDGVIVLDAHGRIVDLNPAARRIVGGCECEVIGRPAAEVLSRCSDWLEKAGADGDGAEGILLGHDRASRVYRVRLSPLYDHHGRINGRIVLLTDVAELQRAEETPVESQGPPTAQRVSEKASEREDLSSSLATSPSRRPSPAESSEGPMGAEQPPLGRKRVMVVDGNGANRTILELQTRLWGMVPVLASSGSEALELIRRGERFDLAILDMHMPEMDGVTLAQEIRRHRDADALPMVVLTSPGHQEADARLDLFAAFLTKPVQATQLYNTLVEVFVVGEGVRMRRE